MMSRWLASMAGWGPEAITLVNDTVTLRPPTRSDYAVWHDTMVRDRDVFAPVQPTWPRDHLSLQSYRRRLAFYADERERRAGFAFHIVHSGDERFLGVIRLSPIHYGAAQSGTLGYWVARSEWGQGFASLAVDAVVTFAFHHLKLHRVQAHCLPDNLASQRVLEKAGFEQEGLLRSFLEIDGVRKDHLLYSTVVHSVHDRKIETGSLV